MDQKVKIAIGLGSNIGDRLSFLKKAAQKISEDVLLSVNSSPVYETKPWGNPNQEKFLNCVVVGISEWKPPALLNYFKNLEIELGRTQTVKYGPREIDIDLLLYGNTQEKYPGLEVPHPKISERGFVLVGMNEIEPDWTHPGLHKTMSELFHQLPESEQTSATYFAEPLPGTKTQ
jgi:2-amino-4-hydroxy-6-hydroxymethyldihydropteridine diphosphokinase